MNNDKGKYFYGWASKLLNVYLKTLIYVSSDFFPNLKEFLHPPIDSILQKNLIRKKLQNKYFKISDLTESKYKELISGYKKIALREKIYLIEIEKYWEYSKNK